MNTKEWVGKRAPAHIQAPCWWFIREVYKKEFGIDLPNKDGIFAPLKEWTRLIQHAQTLTLWEQVKDPKEGDLVLIGEVDNPRHIAMYCADNLIIHLTHDNAGVTTQRLSRYYDTDLVRGVYRLAKTS
jgi:cell wall-associated NlpC family hydrolase